MKKQIGAFWTSLFHDRLFFVTLLQLAVPIAVQNLLINSLSFADTVMIGQLGESEIAAVGLGNQIFFMFILVLFGIGSGASIFVAQYWGKQDIANIRKSQGLCLLMGSSAGLLFALASFFIPELLLGFFTGDPDVIRLGSQYQKITAVSYLFTALSFSYASVLRSVEKPRIPLYVTMVSLFFNIVLNYFFIFGIGAIPPMGVAGAALGTTVARGIEVTVMFIIVYSGKKPGMSKSERDIAAPAAASLGELLSFSKSFVWRYFKTALPVILNEIAWGGGMTVYKAIYARVSTQALASVNIAETVINLLFVLFIGSGNASAVMIGKTIGQGNREQTYNYAKRFAVLSPLLGLIVSVILISIAGPIVGLFNVSDYVKETATAVMYVTALIIPFKVLNLHLVVGIFRGGGDTRFSLLFDLFGVWFIGIPFTYFGGLKWGLAIPLVYFLAGTEEFVKVLIGIPRMVSKKWINDLTVVE